MINRRNFISTLGKGIFTILPGATLYTRVWKVPLKYDRFYRLPADLMITSESYPTILYGSKMWLAMMEEINWVEGNPVINPKKLTYKELLSL